MYYLLLIVPWFATFAMTVQTGLWSNAILLGQIVLSGLVAFGFYQPLAVIMDEGTNGSYTYFMDFLAIWALYFMTMLILKIFDGAFSKTKMRFNEHVEMVGGPLVGFASGAVMSSIVMASLHAAPLSPETMHIDKADINTASSLSNLDLAWLRVVEAATDPAMLGVSKDRAFDAKDYVVLHQQRRTKFSAETSFSVSRSQSR